MRTGLPNGLTGDQSAAVLSEGMRIAVAAGPGSGKTRVLVRRVLYRVAAGKLDLRRVLAITFTENAAAEMKERLAEALDSNPERRRHLESAYISTIHHFCARLLRENAVEAGVDPNFAVLDEIHSSVLRQATLDEVLERGRLRDTEALVEFSRHFKDREYVQTILRLYDKLRRFAVDPGDRAAVLKGRDEFPELLEKCRAELPAEIKKATSSLSGKLRAVQAALNGAMTAGDDTVEACRWIEGAQAAMKGAPKEMPFRVGLETLRRAALERCAAPHRQAVADLMTEFHQAYGQRKRRLAALDFDDLEERTDRMLGASEDLAARVRRRFDEILVDEYQDTSPLQSRIIERLAEGVRLFVVGDPFQSIYGFRNADPEAFRRAWSAAPEKIELRQDFRSRPEIIHAVNAHFETAFLGDSLPFSRLEPRDGFSGKDRPSVEMVMVAGGGGTGSDTGADIDAIRELEARWLARRIRELIESATLRGTNPGEPERLGQPLGYGDVAMLFRSAGDVRTYERALDDEGIPYFSDTGRGFYDTREVRDVVSFLRVLDNASNEIALAATLRSPMFAVSDSALLVIAVTAHAVKGRVIADILGQVDGLPGLTAEDVAGIREFRALDARLRAEMPRRTIAELVREIIEATGYDRTLLLEPGGRRRVANLRKLSDVAESLARAGFDSLGEFTRAVDRFHLEDVREPEAQLDSAAEGAVRLMTMHTAKGLEFGLTVLPDLARGTPRDRDAVDFLPQFGLGVKFARQDEPEATLTHTRIQEEASLRDGRESRRVLFVAMTRAREHLLLSGCLQSQKKGDFAHGSLEALCQSYGLPNPAHVFHTQMIDPEWRVREVPSPVPASGGEPFEMALLVTNVEPGPAAGAVAPPSVRYRDALSAGAALDIPFEDTVGAEARLAVERALTPRPAADRTDFLASATDVTEFHSCPRRYYLGRYLGHDVNQMDVSRPSAESQGPLEGVPLENDPLETEDDVAAQDLPRREIGLAAHRVLAAGRVAARAAMDMLPPTMRAEVAPMVERFWASEIGGRFTSGDVRREWPLLARLGSENRFLGGTLDLLSFDSGGHPDTLLDYKANQVKAADLDSVAEHYRIQMQLYALMVEAACGAPPREALLYFLVPGVARRVEITPEALEEARRAVADLVEAQRSQSFPPRVADHCHRCRFNGNLCTAPLTQPV